jgi:predicted ATPase
MLLESGQLIERPEHYELDGRLEPPTIPDTLHDALMARLDRLGAAKEVTQWGAVLGREFRYDVFAAVTSYDETLLQEALTHLVGAGLVQQQGFVPAASYRFKHALIREVAYHSVLRRRRQAMHAQVAQVLEAQFPVLVETQPEILAQHYTAAGQPAAAIPYWSRAGQQAYRRSAYVEATAHLRQALALLAPLPQTSERLAQELSLQVELGLTLSATQGYTIPEVERAYARARELCQHVEDQTQLVRALRGLMLYYQLCGQLEHAAQLGERFFRLANASSNVAARIAARHFRGTVLFLRGEPAAAQTYHQQALRLYTAQEDREALVRHSTVDSGVSAHSWLALEWWQLGYPDRAMQHCQAAHALAQELAHPASLAHTLLRAAVLHQFRRDAPAVQTQTAAVTTLATAFVSCLGKERPGLLHGQ